MEFLSLIDASLQELAEMRLMMEAALAAKAGSARFPENTAIVYGCARRPIDWLRLGQCPATRSNFKKMCLTTFLF